jgi:hypothetical protein
VPSTPCFCSFHCWRTDLHTDSIHNVLSLTSLTIQNDVSSPDDGGSSQTSVSTYQTTPYNIPEDSLYILVATRTWNLTLVSLFSTILYHSFPHFRHLYIFLLFSIFLFMSMGWDYVTELRLPTGLFLITQVIDTWVWSTSGVMLKGGNRIHRRNICPSATLPITNATWTASGENPGLRGENPGLRGERPATNRLSHGTAVFYLPSLLYLCFLLLFLPILFPFLLFHFIFIAF